MKKLDFEEIAKRLPEDRFNENFGITKNHNKGGKMPKYDKSVGLSGGSIKYHKKG